MRVLDPKLKRRVPIACVLWASLSETVERRIAAMRDMPARIEPTEWRSGPIVRIVHAVGPKAAIDDLVGHLMATEFKRRSVLRRIRHDNGEVRDVAAAPHAPPLT